jgi:hypothetical protein
MPAWPGGIPAAPLLGSLAVQNDDNVLRFQSDVGTPIRRSRYTAQSQRHSFSLILSTAQLATFDYFYKTTLGNGVTSFDFNDPITGVSASFSFAEPYSVQSMAVNGYYVVSVSLIKAAS